MVVQMLSPEEAAAGVRVPTLAGAVLAVLTALVIWFGVYPDGPAVRGIPHLGGLLRFLAQVRSIRWISTGYGCIASSTVARVSWCSIAWQISSRSKGSRCSSGNLSRCAMLDSSIGKLAISWRCRCAGR